MPTAGNGDLRTLAQRVADALPAELVEEVVLTGSVSRGMADEVSDIEMLVVTREPLELEDCFGLARAAGLEDLGSWGAQGGPTRRVSGSSRSCSRSIAFGGRGSGHIALRRASRLKPARLCRAV